MSSFKFDGDSDVQEVTYDDLTWWQKAVYWTLVVVVDIAFDAAVAGEEACGALADWLG